MSSKIITPNEKVNIHIESVREAMSIHGCCSPDLILMVCKIIDVAYDYGRIDGIKSITGKTGKHP